MARNKLSIALELGGAVAPSVGAAFRTVDGHIKKLEDKGNKAKVLKGMIGDIQKLREEWKRAHDSGAAGADKLLRKLDSNLDTLRKQGVEVGRLSREYQRLGREAKAADLQLKGHQQIQQGKAGLKSSIGQAAVGVGLAAVPTTISANYQAIIRDIAIKADVVNKSEETQLTRTVIDTSNATGMSRNDVADLVNQLVGAGMELDKALAYAPTAAKFAVGQGSSGVDTARMIMALQQNAKISDPKVMQQALEAIAYQGQAGSFEASDMAKWFPQLLASMEKNGSTGMDAVTSLGSMLQVQMKTAGSSDDAANNLKNWIEKIGSGDVVKAYQDAGIDYQASLNTGIQKGMNTLEASMALAMRYVEATDPAKAKKIKDAQAGIDQEADPEKARAALDALEKTLRTGDLFADMQVKAALTAYAQNRGLYNDLKNDSQKAAGILDKNLAERRETSSQRWSEMAQAADDAMRSIGDAIRPATDALAQGLTWVAKALTKLSDGAQPVVLGIAGITAAFLAFKTVSSGLKIARGVVSIARGRGLERGIGRNAGGSVAGVELPKTGNRVVDTGLGVLGKVLGAQASNDPVTGNSDETQRVFVVNANAFGGPGGVVPSSARSGGGRGRRGRRQRRARAGATVPVPKVAAAKLPSAIPAPAALAEGVGGLGKVARSIRGVTRLAKRIPGGSVLDAGALVMDTALNAKTRDEKAEGYSGAAGGLAGALAGGAAGAAIGSVVPVIGTVIGGAIGAVLGGMGGESVGGWLGKKLFGDAPEEEKPSTPDFSDASAEAPSSKSVLEAPKLPVAVKAVPRPVPTETVTPLTPVAPLPVKVPIPGDAVRREPVPVPSVQSRSPAPGDALRSTAHDPRAVPSQPEVSFDPRDPDAKDPYLLPALSASKVRFPGADRVSSQQQAPGDAVRNVTKVRPGVPVKPVDQMTDEEIEQAYSKLPAFAQRDPFSGVGGFAGTGAGLGEDFAPTLSLTPPAAKPRPEPPPMDRALALGMAMRELGKVSQVPSSIAPVVSQVVKGGQAEPGAMGDVVRSLVQSVQPPAMAIPEVVKAAVPAIAEGPKVDQSFQYSPTLSVTVEGDARDPDRLFGLLESRLRGSWEAWERERTSRMAAKQLFDAPDVA